MNQARSRRRERFRERIDWIFDAAEVYRIDIEAARDRNEIGFRAKLRGAETLAIEKLLLLTEPGRASRC